MLEFDEVPILAGLSPRARERVKAALRLRHVARGKLILRRGSPSDEIYLVSSGHLRLQPIAGEPRSIGPGAVLGELSLISGQPASATVSALEDSSLWVLPGALVLDLVDEEPSLGRELLRLVTSRLQRSEAARTPSLDRQLVVLAEDERHPLPARAAEALEAAVTRHEACTRRRTFERAAECVEMLEEWRRGKGPEILLVELPCHELDGLGSRLLRSDAVIASAAARDGLSHGAALLATTRDGDGDGAPADPGAPWSFPIAEAELAAVCAGEEPGPRRTPHLDRLARWVARKEIGIALGSGAARGFAHLGVLAELESMGIAVDRICGTSMGGIAGLLFALAGGGERGVELARRTLGRKGAARLRLLPRSAILSDKELRRRAREVAGDRSLGDLPLPVTVVATDLVRGEAVVIDRGPVTQGFFATSAVPGVLPPVSVGGRTLVDGGLVTRIPVEQLPATRCGLRIAVNVLPAPSEAWQVEREARELERRIRRPFGFREVLGRSWNQLGWNHGRRDASEADILLEPRTHEHSGVGFASAWRPLVEAGRRAVQERREELRWAAAEVLGSKPTGAPP